MRESSWRSKATFSGAEEAGWNGVGGWTVMARMLAPPRRKSSLPAFGPKMTAPRASCFRNDAAFARECFRHSDNARVRWRGSTAPTQAAPPEPCRSLPRLGGAFFFRGSRRCAARRGQARRPPGRLPLRRTLPGQDLAAEPGDPGDARGGGPGRREVDSVAFLPPRGEAVEGLRQFGIVVKRLDQLVREVGGAVILRRPAPRRGMGHPLQIGR